MLYAQHNGGRVYASRDLRAATCPICDGQVIAKCGEIVVWHWAHQRADCDPWSEPESAWHKNWKELFPIDWREVKMGSHRCDVRTPTHIIELQHSSIGPLEIQEREAFYGQMIWIFDLRLIAHNLTVPEQQQGAFRWPRFRRSLASCQRPVFVHLRRGELLNVFDYGEPKYYCQYRRFTKDEFLAAVGARPAGNPIPMENFRSVTKESLKRARERRWQEHLFRTQPWLKRPAERTATGP